MLSDFRKLVKNSSYFSRPAPPSQEAGMKLSRRILTGCWPSLLSILSRGVGAVDDEDGELLAKALKRMPAKAQEVVGKLTRFKTNLEKLALGKGKGLDERTLVLSLEGLQRSARLCNVLGLCWNFHGYRTRTMDENIKTF